MPILRDDTPTATQGLQSMARETGKGVDRLRASTMRHQAFGQLSPTHVALVGILNDAHGRSVSHARAAGKKPFLTQSRR